MKILSEAGRLLFAMLALILVAMLTTPSGLTSSEAVVAPKPRTIASTHSKNPTKKLAKN
jgi:hypothetical protein